MDDDLRYLNLSGLFHFVVAVLAALFASFPILQLLFGLSFIADVPKYAATNTFPFPFLLLPLAFILIPAAMIVIGWMFAIAVALAGYYIRKRRLYRFCFAMAAIETVFMPFGTALGILTILLLSKWSVRTMFDTRQDGQPLPVP